ncbi:restriction endonuclease [Vibrio parahaemolyticus]|uniref:restriction endonuclease subunit S n=1 Tax=Vibrio TaxID=662 RepID=UPI000A3A71DA|nr:MULTISPECIES: restriction endonuclease subunit S [Vibrio]HDY7972612.1 restriction endonuclease subunit S [Vibrio vulnificus]MCR9657487.1 restriction endonuclease subunit S [Vibrio parahaemolyticus]OUJ52010.1 restriction endonuclease [Vibrio parahaemolyticus]TOA31417.1 restriction endonuclease [Vibrio parahaemolyticus]HCG8026544.1 restriction endonuclease subunit S [Vibrio parahaemolyticus]
MAVENLITEHIDIWTSAVKTKSTSGRGSSKKLELYGIKKLRKLILELAVHGKLVPQDPNDEPADILVQRIMAKKKELLADGTLKKTKKSKVHDAIISAEELPLGWVAADFGDITFNLDAQRIPLSVSERKGRQGIYDYYGASGVIDSIDAYLFDKPLLLIGEDGANLVNRSTPIAFMARGKYWVNNHAHVIDGISEDFLIYLSLYINSISLIPYITGIAQPKMNQAKMNSILVLLPPEKEQHRIVAKVDELMALCDKLEQQTESSIEAHQVLVTTLLDTLTNSADANELMQNWARISEHFDTLFTTEECIDQLKQTILQLAVMGKLVPQDPSDEPAAELLKRIAEEKAQLVKEKKIKKQKALPPIAEDEKPFELPNGWSFSRLESLSELITKGSSPKWQGVSYTENPEDVLFVTSENVGAFKLLLDNEKYVEKKFNDIEPRSILKQDDFLMNIVGASIGRTALFDSDRVANINQAVCLIRILAHELIPEFFLIFFNSRICISYMYDKQVDNARPNLSMSNISKFVIPIPPVREQKLVVAMVNHFMDVCDQLKTRLKESQITQLHLTDAIVEQAV